MTFRKIFSIYGLRTAAVLLLPAVMATSCKKFVDIGPSTNSVAASNAFSSDGTATSSVLSLYSYYNTTYCISYFNYIGEVEAGTLNPQGSLLTADMIQFQQSTVGTTNSTLDSYLWIYPYAVMRDANLAVEGLTNNTVVTDSLRKQLLGEAKFFRAYVYYNMVNFLGGVPLVLTSSVATGGALPRSTADQVYAQIETDLLDAEQLLPTTYVVATPARTRANKYAAAALLARVYLQHKEYANAETQASMVLNASDVTYSLPDAANAFINTSNETILQFSTYYGYSVFGAAYRTASATTLPSYTLDSAAANLFEAGDTRRTNWVDSITTTGKYYRVNKYKLVTATAGNECNVMFRLAEQYLIRAEARAQQNNISGAQSDINAVRTRAGLGGTAAATTSDLITAVLAERQRELFGEGPFRWFDLIRTGNIDAVMSAKKPTTWKSTAALLPIPYAEMLKNASLTQNDGYE